MLTTQSCCRELNTLQQTVPIGKVIKRPPNLNITYLGSQQHLTTRQNKSAEYPATIHFASVHWNLVGSIIFLSKQHKIARNHQVSQC